MNKYAKEEVFGVDELTKEQKDQKRSKFGGSCCGGKGVIHPLSTFRQTWDSFFIIAGAYVVTLMPYRIAFVETFSLPCAHALPPPFARGTVLLSD